MDKQTLTIPATPETLAVERHIIASEHLTIYYDGTNEMRERIEKSGVIPKGFTCAGSGGGYSLAIHGSTAHLSNFEYTLLYTRSIKPQVVEIDAP